MARKQDIPLVTHKSLFKKFYDNYWSLVLLIGMIVAMIADYAFFDNLNSSIGNWFYVIMAGSFLFQIALVSSKALRFLSDDLVEFLGNHLLLGFLFALVIPPGSPYDLILLYAVTEAVFWFGLKGYALSFSYFYAVLMIRLVVQGGSLYQSLMTIGLLGAVGAIIERLTASQRRERKDLITFNEQARFERERLEALINSMADAVLAIDEDGTVLLYNAACLELFNTNHSLHGKTIDDLMRLKDANQQPVDIIDEVKRAKHIIKRDDLTFTNNNDETVNLSFSIARVYLGYAANQKQGYTCLLRDITKEKSIEQQRDEFISVVSHELRTPLAIAEGNVSTAIAGLKNENAKLDPDQLMNEAHKNIIFLSQMVNDITTLAKAESGELGAKPETVDPGKLLLGLVDTYAPQAKAKGVDFMLEPGSEVNSFTSNAYRIQEIMQNFITNAIKYTDEGKITIGVTQLPDQRYQFFVTDTGPGITTSDQKHLFEKFWRSEDYTTREHSGTGIGLYLSKKLAERMRGEVGVESVKDKGSTFTLTLSSLDESGAEKHNTNEA
ncbi:MAG: ATP-binding protein [Candidatus Saccharibacteria bacterium]|nr:ATP-binding protein [Candidatus Saccharibacteria bacterium]